MKYLNKKLSTPANSQRFVDNWDAVFGNEPPKVEEPKTELPDKFKTQKVDGVPFDI